MMLDMKGHLKLLSLLHIETQVLCVVLSAAAAHHAGHQGPPEAVGICCTIRLLFLCIVLSAAAAQHAGHEGPPAAVELAAHCTA
jgi:hypothetical protein